MPRTVKVELDKDAFRAESSDLLKGVRSDKLIEVAPYQVRALFDLRNATATEMAKKAAVAAAQREADSFTNRRFAEIDKLVAELKALLAKDKKGDGAAAEEAQDLVKRVADKIEETVPDFGKLMRKALESKVGKLPGGRNEASGGFRGIKLVAKFEHAGAAGLDVKIKDPTVKAWLLKHEQLQYKTLLAEIQIVGAEADGLVKVINKFYEVACAKTVHHYIICEINGNVLTMVAIYRGAGKKKEWVAGAHVKDIEL